MDYKFRFPSRGRTLKQDLPAPPGPRMGLGLWIGIAAVGAFSACSDGGSSFDDAAGSGGAPAASGGSSTGGATQPSAGGTSMGGAIGNGGSASAQGGSVGSAGASGTPSAGQSSGGSAQGGSVNPSTGGAPTAGTGAGGAPTAGTGAGGAPTAGTGAGGAPTAGTGAGGAPTAGTGAGGSPPTAGSGGAGPVRHEFFAADNARHVLNYVNEFDPSKNWSKTVSGTTVNSPRQVELVDNSKGSGGKAIMVSVHQGYEEYDMVTGARLVSVLSQADVRGAVRLADGNTVLGVGDSTMRVVNAAGTQVSSCTLPGAGPDSLRVINRDPGTGFFLLGRLTQVFIVNAQCQQQWTATLPAGGKAYSVFPRAGGGVWATSGAPSTVVEYNMQGMILKQLGGKTAHPGLGLDFFSGFELLPNGNVVAANWQGHVGSPAATTPHLVEFDQTNKLVWRWGNQTLARQITNTLIIR